MLCFVLLLVLVLVLVLVLEAIEYTHQVHWSASYPEPPRSTIGIAAVQTAIEYEYDEIRKEARTHVLVFFVLTTPATKK
jgi:hypothetical protein